MEATYKTHSEAMRQLLELAISCGRCWQSSQTDYIHYCYTIRDESTHQPIPTYENFLFILALMRSRSIENINEAKSLLTRLLHFQSPEGEMAGNFPIYLHEFPFCKDRLWGAQLLAPMHWIYKNFHHVLGAELKQALKIALVKLVEYCLKADHAKKAPYSTGLKIAACAKSVGVLLGQNRLLEQGEELYEELQRNRDLTTWNSPASLSSLIVAYQMVFSSFQQSAEKEFWRHLTETWHPTLGVYCGPGWKESQEGAEPQVTLYDYFMGYLSGKYSHRCFTDHPVQLQAALLHPTDDTLPLFEPPEESHGVLKEIPWKVSRQQKMAYSIMSKESVKVPVQEKTFSPLKVLWGNSHRLHSLVCQGGTSPQVEVMSEGNTIELLFSFNEAPLVDDEEKSQEICFYVDEHGSMDISVDNIQATTFRMGDHVVITDGELKMTLTFHIESGEGEFFGHLMKANRPSQISRTGPHRFSVFDRQIFLRTIRRSDACVVKAHLTITAG